MTRPTISANEAVAQAGTTVAQYLSQARAILDERFDPLENGTPFSQAHPELLAALVQAQASDLHSVSICDALNEVAEAVRYAGDAISLADALIGAPK